MTEAGRERGRVAVNVTSVTYVVGPPGLLLPPLRWLNHRRHHQQQQQQRTSVGRRLPRRCPPSRLDPTALREVGAGGDGEEEGGLSRSAARLEERRSDQEVRAKRWKERRLLLQVFLPPLISTVSLGFRSLPDRSSVEGGGWGAGVQPAGGR